MMSEDSNYIARILANLSCSLQRLRAENRDLHARAANMESVCTYLVLHKPTGLVCARCAANSASGKGKAEGNVNRLQETVFALLPTGIGGLSACSPARKLLQPVGRLDKETEGLLFFTGPYFGSEQQGEFPRLLH